MPEHPPANPVATREPGVPAGVRRAVFVLGAAYSATPWASAPMALTLGAALALAGLTAFEPIAKPASRQILQWCVASLGLLLPLTKLLQLVREGLGFAACTIGATLAAGWALGKLLRTGSHPSLLISSGTAICGGSAIAAVGSAVGASSAHMAIATGAIFLMNAAGLYSFPHIAHALHLSDAKFGAWCGVALHDVASVTGAAAGYHEGAGSAGSAALDTATVVKLSRVLWIVPITLVAGLVHAARSSEVGWSWRRVPVPWMVILFLGASAARTFIPALAEHEGLVTSIRAVAQLGFQLALFLVGAGLSRSALAAVGWRALVQALVLWLAVAGVTLEVIRRGAA